MGKNGKLPSTVTRSISFRFDTLAALDARVAQVRSDRSSFVNGAMEHLLGIMDHPELVGRTVPFLPDVDESWRKEAKRLERLERDRSEAGTIKSVLVKRPGRKLVK